jgi:hypothetical protein
MWNPNTIVDDSPNEEATDRNNPSKYNPNHHWWYLAK